MRDHAGLVASSQQQRDGFATARSEVERPVVDVHTDKLIGLAMIEAAEPIDDAWISAGEWTVQIANSIYPATVSLRPLYDPQNLKIKA